MSLVVRHYRADDAGVTWRVFHAAVRRTAAHDYTPAAVRVWAPDRMDLDAWARKRALAHTFVAEVGQEVVGFSDITTDGLLDMLFVHPDHGRQGVARALVERVLSEARASNSRES